MSVRSVDPTRDIPVGRVPGSDGDRRAQFTSDQAGWTLQAPYTRARHGNWDVPAALGDHLATLDIAHVLEVSGTVPTGAQPALSTFLTRTVARGTLVAGHVPSAIGRTLPFEVPTEVPAHPGLLDFDTVAVRQRRAVLATMFTDLPHVTAVLVTRRPHLLPRVLGMLAAQTHRNLDVVVVLHGSEPVAGDLTAGSSPTAGREVDGTGDPAGGQRWEKAAQPLPVTVLVAPASMTLGAALQLGSESASGPLLAKIDDDDWYGPDHVLDLALAHRYSGAQLVGKSTTVVFLEALNTTVRRVFGAPEAPINRVAGGTILLSADTLTDVGGWSDVPRAVDSALISAVRRHHGEIYRPHDIGYIYARHAPKPGDGHTWTAGNGHFLTSVREQWLGLLHHPDFGTAGPATQTTAA